MIIETKMHPNTNVSQILSGLSGPVNKGKTRMASTMLSMTFLVGSYPPHQAPSQQICF